MKNTKKNLKSAVNNSIIGTAVAMVLTLALVLIWKAIAVFYVTKIIGRDAAMAVEYANSAFFSQVFALLPFGAVLFWILSAIFKRQAAVQFVAGIILTILSCVVGVVFQNHTIMHSNVSESFIDYAKMLSAGYGLVFPMVLGSLAICSYDRAIIKCLLLQVLMAVCFLVLSWMAGVFMLVVLSMGISAFSIGNLFAAVVTFGFAVLTSEGFRQLLTPK